VGYRAIGDYLLWVSLRDPLSLLCLAAFLTNQFHKWAHMDTPPAFVSWLQEWGVILSREHHDIHHESPYDTYYCITTGFWNPAPAFTSGWNV
jgi:Lipid desaturase domain